MIRNLARHHIFLENEEQLSEFHVTWLRNYFHRSIRQYICPILVDTAIDLGDVLADDSTYLVVEMRQGEVYHYALVEVPTDYHSRFSALQK